MKINPTLDRVIVKKCKFDDVYKSSIVLLESQKDDINKLIYDVVKVGPGGVIDNNIVEMVVKPNDRVIIPQYIGSEIEIDNIIYRIVKQNEILAIIIDN